MKLSKVSIGTFLAVFFLSMPCSLYCQTEKLDIVQFTPPKGWTKTPKDGAMVLGDINKTTGSFCLLTVYNSSPSMGSPQKDFASEWNNRVVKPFSASADTKTETQSNSDGWQATVGGSTIEFNGIKAAAVLTVFSGFGRSASILAIFNDESYLPQADAFISGIKLDKTAPSSTLPPKNAPDPGMPNSEYLDFDPFPDKPHFQAQEPLVGRLRKSITMADLVGNWTTGGGSIMQYVVSSTQVEPSVSVTRDDFTIRPNGTYESKSQSRLSNTTVRESERGTVILSGNWVIRRDSNGREMRYQFITYMVLPNGAAMLTLILTPEGPPMDAQALSYNCGHAHGYITCNAGEEWVRKP